MGKLLSIIYPYRNRELVRLRKSLDSLNLQSCMQFEVFFVNYGSNSQMTLEVEKLCRSYSFVKYQFIATQYQPWNKSKALNSVIKNLETQFCFIADVDMIFHTEFIKKALELQEPEKAIYFQVGFLNRNERNDIINFQDTRRFRLSSNGATGLTMFPVKILKYLRGFDEFYHFWGAEDTDMHVRMENAGYEVEFYEDDVLMLHQWHPSYRSTESLELGENMQINGIVQLNQQHLNHAIQFKTTKVNFYNWGECITIEELNELEKASVNSVLDNEQRKIDHFLHVIMPETKNQILKIIINKNPFENSIKFRLKRLMRKKVPEYYSLKEINDKILLHLISFYRNNAYTYKISENIKSIEVAIKM